MNIPTRNLVSSTGLISLTVVWLLVANSAFAQNTPKSGISSANHADAGTVTKEAQLVVVQNFMRLIPSGIGGYSLKIHPEQEKRFEQNLKLVEGIVIRNAKYVGHNRSYSVDFEFRVSTYGVITQNLCYTTLTTSGSSELYESEGGPIGFRHEELNLKGRKAVITETILPDNIKIFNIILCLKGVSISVSPSGRIDSPDKNRQELLDFVGAFPDTNLSAMESLIKPFVKNS